MHPYQFSSFGFWLALALVVVAIIWAAVRKQQMRHELTLKLLEKGGQGVDPELLSKLIAPQGGRLQKSAAEQHREGGGVVGFLFVLVGLMISFVAMARHDGPSWSLLGLGVFSVLLGIWIWHGTMKEYQAQKELEKDLSRN